VKFTECDVTEWRDLENLITVAQKEFGDVPDVYVPGAGIFEPVSRMSKQSKPTATDSFSARNGPTSGMILSQNATHNSTSTLPIQSN
jgi:hypothetical protein